jgi:hypothetical protein
MLSGFNPLQLTNNPEIGRSNIMQNSTKSRSQLPGANWNPAVFIAALLMMMTANTFAAAKFVSGLAPDWNQPYRYVNPNGPGPDPSGLLHAVNQWNDWCAPTSAANLAGYWADARGVTVADTTSFPNSTVAWAVGPSWQDYLADGTTNRPQPQAVAGSLPVPTTDIGWYMDANRGVPYDHVAGSFMGGWFFGNVNHPGTYLKDIHAGLQNYLNCRYGLSGSVFWRTGTRGIAFAAGTDPSGASAAVHLNEASAFAEVMSEIDTNRTLILCFTHWNISASPFTLAPVGIKTESALGGTYYTWGPTPGPNPTNAEDEVWNYSDYDTALGHAVTAVGYIRAGDVDDPGPTLPGIMAPTDWVIVHDNWSTTPRNVIIPYGSPNPPSNGTFVATWVADTTAVPWPTAAKFVKGVVPDWNQPYRYTAQFPKGGPGPDPNNINIGQPFPFVDQWNDWCAPSSAANLAGHWADQHGAPVADTTPSSGSTVAWKAGPSWQDYLADGFARPAPQGAPGPLPASPTDIGWYMDSNLGVLYDPPAVGVMGGFFFGNGPHAGTFLKDIHVGLQNYLNSLYSCSNGVWNTGTEGRGFAAGMNPTGGAAQILGDPVTAFNEVTNEINRNHTLILCYLHWNVGMAPADGLPSVNTNTESDFGGTYYQWGPPPAPGTTNAENEVWNLYDGGMGLGHAVTVVGYIPQGDILDPGPGLLGIMAPTDWVIVHDNWFSTPRNVIIPFDFVGNGNWVANTYAWPDPGFLRLTNIIVAGRTNAVVSLTGIPGCCHDLLCKTNLLADTWFVCVSNVAFKAGTMRITNTVSINDPQRFYRIKASY